MDKILFYPVRPLHVNQPFGANDNAFYAQGGLKGHPGIDFMATHGQPIYASHDGQCFPEIDGHGGNGVKLVSPDKSFYTIYWHMIQDNAVVQTFDQVKAGDLLGYADNTGDSTGDHLHFGLHILGTDLQNGYNGFSDPQPYFNGQFAEFINHPLPPPPKFQFNVDIRLKAWSNDVKQLQILLQKQNLYTGAIDGIFGRITEVSVKVFQTAHNLVPDGIVGPKTRAVLNTLI
jgi:murein DD-endopeptidase MepM/ murein hydrolase activator NlpD